MIGGQHDVGWLRWIIVVPPHYCAHCPSKQKHPTWSAYTRSRIQCSCMPYSLIVSQWDRTENRCLRTIRVFQTAILEADSDRKNWESKRQICRFANHMLHISLLQWKCSSPVKASSVCPSYAVPLFLHRLKKYRLSYCQHAVCF